MLRVHVRRVAGHNEPRLHGQRAGGTNRHTLGGDTQGRREIEMRKIELRAWEQSFGG